MTLTPRETEVVSELALGTPRKEIAYRFGIDIKTVDAHVTNARHKLGAHSWVEMVRISIRDGLVRWNNRDKRLVTNQEEWF